MSESRLIENGKKEVKVSPCKRYERHEETSDNLFEIGVSYMAIDLEEATEVLWVEMKLFDNDSVLIRHHFDSLIRLSHPNVVNLNTYWIEETVENSNLYLICELIGSTLSQLIKRTKLNKKSIPVKTQVRICRQILIALAYLRSYNPPFYIPRLSCKSVFMTHGGTIKVSGIIPNTTIYNILTNSNIALDEDQTPFYLSIQNFGRILYSMVSLDTIAYDLNEILKKLANEPSCSEHAELINVIIKHENIGITDLLKTKLLFCFPTLKLLAGYTIIKQKIDYTNCKLEYEPSAIFATYVEADKKVAYSDIPSLDLKKYLNEIRLGLYPLTNIASIHYTGKLSNELHHSVNTPINTNSANEQPPMRNVDSLEVSESPMLSRLDDEISNEYIGKILAIQCNSCKNNIENDTNIYIQLNIIILYSGLICRHLVTNIDDNNALTAQILTDDLITKKLIPEKYKSFLMETIQRALKGEELSLLFHY